MDQDNDNTIDVAELREFLLNQLNANSEISEAEHRVLESRIDYMADKLIRKGDSDGNMVLSIKEAIEALQTWQHINKD